MDIQQILAEKALKKEYRSWFPKEKNPVKSYSLKSEKMVSAYDDVIAEANHLDCIWFEGDRNIPAIFKVCKSNDYITALYRLKTVKELIPPFYISFFIIAPDTVETEIRSELTKPVFKNFDVKIIPFSKLQSFDLN